MTKTSRMLSAATWYKEGIHKLVPRYDKCLNSRQRCVPKLVYSVSVLLKATGSYRTYSSLETATLVPEFAVEDLPLGRTAAFVPEFCRERPALGQNTNDYVLSLKNILVWRNVRYFLDSLSVLHGRFAR